MTVDARDRRAMARQAAALRAHENNDEGDAQWNQAVVAGANLARQARGMAPLEPWWTYKTEVEIHKRARALGLLGRVR